MNQAVSDILFHMSVQACIFLPFRDILRNAESCDLSCAGSSLPLCACYVDTRPLSYMPDLCMEHRMFSMPAAHVIFPPALCKAPESPCVSSTWLPPGCMAEHLLGLLIPQRCFLNTDRVQASGQSGCLLGCLILSNKEKKKVKLTRSTSHCCTWWLPGRLWT